MTRNDSPVVLHNITEKKYNKALNVSATDPIKKESEQPYKDWVFINYTFKRFEGLTQRGALKSVVLP